MLRITSFQELTTERDYVFELVTVKAGSPLLEVYEIVSNWELLKVLFFIFNSNFRASQKGNTLATPMAFYYGS